MNFFYCKESFCALESFMCFKGLECSNMLMAKSVDKIVRIGVECTSRIDTRVDLQIL